MRFVFQDSQMNKVQKLLVEMEIFCNVINVFTVTFDQFNVVSK